MKEEELKKIAEFASKELGVELTGATVTQSRNGVSTIEFDKKSQERASEKLRENKFTQHLFRDADVSIRHFDCNDSNDVYVRFELNNAGTIGNTVFSFKNIGNGKMTLI